MNIDPVTRGLIDKFAPQLGQQIDAVQKLQVAFSVALTPAQQEAVRATIKKGASNFISWSKTEEGITAIRAFADAFTGAPVTPQRPADLVKEKNNVVA